LVGDYSASTTIRGSDWKEYTTLNLDDYCGRATIAPTYDATQDAGSDARQLEETGSHNGTDNGSFRNSTRIDNGENKEASDRCRGRF
jgi:hypothetical protein